jgi:hypothetical protein
MKIVCLHCEGEGYTSSVSCTYPSWMCCGGCYEKEKCEICYGYGSLEPDLLDYEQNRLYSIFIDAHRNKEAHQSLINNLEEALNCLIQSK